MYRVFGDGDVEPDESVVLDLSTPTNATFAGGATEAQAVSWIVDEDTGPTDPAPLSLFVNDVEILEGDAGNRTASFRLELSRPATEDLTFGFETADGTAPAGSDYIATSGEAIIPRGQTGASVGVEVKGDIIGAYSGPLPTDIGSETFDLIIRPAGEIVSGASAVGRIRNDDPDVVYGGNGDNTIDGTADADVIFGQGGDDLISGLASGDSLHGGPGHDTIDGGAGSDTIIGGSGKDVALFLGDGPIDIDLGSGRATGQGEDRLGQIEDARSGSGDDVLRGSAEANRLEGGAGEDTLAGRGGNDVLDGGDGDDELDGAGGRDVFVGGAGADVNDGGGGRDRVTYARSADGVDVDLDGSGNGGDASEDRYLSIENVDGSRHDDTLDGDRGGNVLSGDRGDDALIGQRGTDRLFGGAGDDTMDGGGGDDRIVGGDGDDEGFGSAGRDSLFGNVGADRLSGDASNDRIDGGRADDLLSGGDGRDVLIGGGGSDGIGGGGGADRILAGPGNDTIAAGGQDDRIHVGGGRDTLILEPGDGRDRVTGFGPNDRVDLTAFEFDGLRDLVAAVVPRGGDTVLRFGNGDVLTLEDIRVGELSVDNALI